jgi:hypothetical protein
MPSSFFQPNFRTLDLNLLRVFDEVMAERSLTRGRAQPVVDPTCRQQRLAPTS